METPETSVPVQALFEAMKHLQFFKSFAYNTGREKQGETETMPFLDGSGL